MKKKVIGILFLMCIIGSFAALQVAVSAAESGQCGDSLTWTFDDDGTLTISGEGDMRADRAWLQLDVKNVIIEDGVTSIDSYAFNVSAIETADIPGSVTSIGDGAFAFCPELKKINIPDSVTYLGKSAFAACDSAESIYIGSGVTDIKEDTFAGCVALTEVTVPESVKYIGRRAFADCENLQHITIFGDVTSIGAYAFSRCVAIDDIILPDSVTSIGNNAFEKCKALKTITVGSGLEAIGDNAFMDSGITELSLPATLSRIGIWVFNGCVNLESIEVDEANQYFSSQDGNLFNKDKTELIRYAPAGSAEAYDIPDSVVKISQNAFRNCKNLKHVTLPQDMTEVNDWAFYMCLSVEEVDFHDNITSIGSDAFYGCESLKSAELPDSITNIGDRAFNTCRSLESVKLPGGLKTIGNSVFFWCALKSVTIPDGVEMIDNFAFHGCSELTDITIPQSVTSIGEGVFYDCGALADIYYSGSMADWNDISIADKNSGIAGAELHCGGVSVTYEPNFNSQYKNRTTVERGGDIVLTDDIPQRAGHTFLGWALSPDAEAARYRPGDTITAPAADITVYALWEETSYTRTELSGNKLTVTPEGIPEGSSIILACYKDGVLVYISRYEYDNSETVQFETDKEYDSAKVFVWDDEMTPVAEPERII